MQGHHFQGSREEAAAHKLLNGSCSKQLLLPVAFLSCPTACPDPPAPLDTPAHHRHQDLKANIHPALGYNAITNSPDPMDDFGHGTHVAGIIAGGRVEWEGRRVDRESGKHWDT